MNSVIMNPGNQYALLMADPILPDWRLRLPSCPHSILVNMGLPTDPGEGIPWILDGKKASQIVDQGGRTVVTSAQDLAGRGCLTARAEQDAKLELLTGLGMDWAWAQCVYKVCCLTQKLKKGVGLLKAIDIGPMILIGPNPNICGNLKLMKERKKLNT